MGWGTCARLICAMALVVPVTSLVVTAAEADVSIRQDAGLLSKIPSVSMAPPSAGADESLGTASQSSSSSFRESSDDLIVAALGDESGYHLYLARERSRWLWRPLASLAPGGEAEGEWTGYHCVTGSSRYVVAVVAPTLKVNSPVVRDRGASAFVVDIESGDVRPFVSGVALKYFSPSCGLDDRVTLVRHLGVDQEATEVLVLDVNTGRTSTHFVVPGQLASPVVVGDSVYGARGSAIERVQGNEMEMIADVPGQPYMLRATAAGLAFLTADDTGTAKVWTLEGEDLTKVGHGRLGRVKLFPGSDRAVIVGASSLDPTEGLTAVEAKKAALGSSVLGGAVLVPRGKAHRSRPLFLQDGLTGSRIAGRMPEVTAPLTTLIPIALPSLPPATFRSTDMEQLDNVQTGAAEAIMAVGGGPYTTLNGADEEADGGGVPAKCAVPRNHDRRQVPQPDAAQVDWAIQMATRNLLVGQHARPANFLNMGLAGYSPSNDFRRHPLAGVDSSVPVPPSVIQGTFAQESAWRHATFRALPGVSGNPLIGDFYGAAGDINTIDYPNADCGYGVGQVTTPMTKAATAYSTNGKTKVAVDYAENTAASIQFLVDKWNQLHGAGVILNNGDPRYLENWYFAIWAYNTGYHANSGTGPWGLGWTNNPMNSDYPPDRTPFLRSTYADAEHPADWPYQERVFGWMETPLFDYRGDRAYASPNYQGGNPGAMHIPDRTTFCTSSNECDVNYIDPTGQGRDYCTRADRKCWWHEPVTFVPDCLSACAQSAFTVATGAGEPQGDDNYPPACNSSLPAEAIIVDELTDPSLQVEGCGSRDWTPQGTFEMELGKDAASGDMLGIIDWHQLGAGFGGHTWFTKNRSSSSDTSHINTGTWTPSGLQAGLYNVSVHVPSSGASTASARYRVFPGDGTDASRTVDQHLHRNQWVSLGNFTLQPGAKVELSNLTSEVTPGSANVAFDAVAFVPISASGNVVTKRIDAVALFDAYQRLDTDDAWWTALHPFRTMESIHQWGTELTSAVTGFPRCLNTAGGQLSASCVGDRTHAAYSAWHTAVASAGNGNGVQWSNEALPQTQADWLSFSNPRIGAVLSAGELSDPGDYKLHQRLRLEYVAEGGQIVEGSVSLTGQQRVGDTHLPSFIRDIMRAYRDDYGVALPDLSYTAEDLRLWTHSSSSADPMVDGVMPGQAYMDKKSFAPAGDSCVRVRGVGGGTIGYRPMLAQGYVRAEVDAWRERVEAVVDQGRAPEAVLTPAADIDDIFFDNFVFYEPDRASLFYTAPPIWTEVDALACADGSLQGSLGNLVDGSWMPDVYVFINGVAASQDGSPMSCGAASRGCSVIRGDFVRFTHLATAADDPWNQCDFVTAGRRNGNPWEIMPWDAADIRPTKVKYCADAHFTGHE